MRKEGWAMRNGIPALLLIMAVLFAGCATADKPAGSGGKDAPPPAVKPYE
jgi:predicted small secreted protein